MTIEVLFFGPAKGLAGTDSARLEASVGTAVGGLRAILADRFTGLAAGLPSMRLAVNESFAADGLILKPGDRVAIIPPVSGG